MDQPARPRLTLPVLLAVSAILAGLTTYGLVLAMDAITPPCGGPFCFFALVWLSVSGLGAAIVALVIAKIARRGATGYAGALVAGLVGFVVAWMLLGATF